MGCRPHAVWRRRGARVALLRSPIPRGSKYDCTRNMLEAQSDKLKAFRAGACPGLLADQPVKRPCCKGECRVLKGPVSSGKTSKCRPETGLFGEFCALGLQHGMRTEYGLQCVPSATAAGGANAIDSRRIAADSGSVRLFLR